MGGIVIAVAGVWVLSQVLLGDIINRLGLAKILGNG
jgi:hypothetical protein